MHRLQDPGRDQGTAVRLTPTPYHGRFAPTPSGPLHFGSIIAALGSYLHARSCNGRWTLRIDDLDRPRVQAGASDSILRDLERLGLYWDDAPVYQSKRLDRYHETLAELRDRGLAFACGCTRAETRGVYPGTCREGLPAGRRARSIRLRVPSQPLTFTDAIHGVIMSNIAETIGDFIIRRADGIIAYHLAVVVDDTDAGITDIVRGADLLDCTPPQILLQQLLGLPSPAYMHLPVAIDSNGRKFSKQNHAAPIADEKPADVLSDALVFLGQQPEPALRRACLADIHAWALANWNPAYLPRTAVRRVYSANSGQ